jgi:hypothetical protein
MAILAVVATEELACALAVTATVCPWEVASGAV